MITIRDGLDCSKIVRGAELLPTGSGVWPPKPWTSYLRISYSMNNFNNRRTVTVLIDNLEVTLEQFGADTVPHLHCIFPAPRPYVAGALPEPKKFLTLPGAVLYDRL